DDFINDYLLTNIAVDLEGRAEGIAKKLTEMTGRPASHGAVVAFLGVEAEYLDGAFAEITARHGSLRAYLEQEMGVGDALAEGMRARLAAGACRSSMARGWAGASLWRWRRG